MAALASIAVAILAVVAPLIGAVVLGSAKDERESIIGDLDLMARSDLQAREKQQLEHLIAQRVDLYVARQWSPRYRRIARALGLALIIAGLILIAVIGFVTQGRDWPLFVRLLVALVPAGLVIGFGVTYFLEPERMLLQKNKAPKFDNAGNPIP